ncbi:MAG: indole-3-glycerol phosphate synthase TrpC [Bacteroidota bacterium]
MSTILDRIVEQTRSDLNKRKQAFSLSDLETLEGFEKPRLDFKTAITQPDTPAFVPRIIAEVKKASPSKGIIRDDFSPVDLAMQYEEGGASAISVLTDAPFFKGDLKYLEAISKRVKLPLLRKDFIVDPFQIKEARAYGADAVLIIVAITQGEQLNELIDTAHEFGLSALVECYDQSDFDRCTFDRIQILGVNNRDLKTFKVNVHQGINILNQAPDEVVLVSESGLNAGRDLALIAEHSIDAALIGEHFMRQPNPGDAVKVLIEQTEEIQEVQAHG